jgi:hypothetical protein
VDPAHVALDQFEREPLRHPLEMSQRIEVRTGDVARDHHPPGSGKRLAQELQPLGADLELGEADACGVQPRPGEALHQPDAHGVGDTEENDRNRIGRFAHARGQRRRVDEDGVGAPGDQRAGDLGIENTIEVSESHVEREIAAFDEAALREAFDDQGALALDRAGASAEEQADA